MAGVNRAVLAVDPLLSTLMSTAGAPEQSFLGPQLLPKHKEETHEFPQSLRFTPRQASRWFYGRNTLLCTITKAMKIVCTDTQGKFSKLRKKAKKDDLITF